MIKNFKRGLDPDYLFIEPYELVVTAEMLTALAMGTRDVRYEIGPVIALINAGNFDDEWGERRQTLVNYMNGSKAVAISHADAVDDSQLQTIYATISETIDHDVIFPLSIFDGRGMDELMAVVTG